MSPKNTLVTLLFEAGERQLACSEQGDGSATSRKIGERLESAGRQSIGFGRLIRFDQMVIRPDAYDTCIREATEARDAARAAENQSDAERAVAVIEGEQAVQRVHASAAGAEADFSGLPASSAHAAAGEFALKLPPDWQPPMPRWPRWPRGPWWPPTDPWGPWGPSPPWDPRVALAPGSWDPRAIFPGGRSWGFE